MAETKSQDVFGGILWELASAHAVVQEERAHLAQLEADRDQAVATAGQPFTERIAAANVAIRHAETPLSVRQTETAIRELFSPGSLPLVALQLMLERSRVGVDQFAEYLVRLSQSSAPEQAAGQRVHADINCFMAINGALEAAGDAGAPIAAFGLDWHENTDPQAEFEGRPSGTGVWEKQLSGYFGRVGLGDVRVVTTDIAPDNALLPLVKPTEIRLTMGAGALTLATDVEWGYLESTLEPTVEPVDVVLLSAVGSEQRFPGMRLHNTTGPDFALSAAHEWGLKETRGFTSPRVCRADRRYFVVVGHGAVGRCLDELQSDVDLPERTKEHLATVAKTVSIDK